MKRMLLHSYSPQDAPFVFPKHMMGAARNKVVQAVRNASHILCTIPPSPQDSLVSSMLLISLQFLARNALPFSVGTGRALQYLLPKPVSTRVTSLLWHDSSWWPIKLSCSPVLGLAESNVCVSSAQACQAVPCRSTVWGWNDIAKAAELLYWTHSCFCRLLNWFLLMQSQACSGLDI